MRHQPQTVDRSALRFNQGSIITLVMIGFVFDQPLLPALVAAVLIGGSISPALALFKLTYLHVIKPMSLMKPDLSEESAAPHEFAQLLGGAVLGVGVTLVFFGSPAIGWVLAWGVILLAAANLFFGFCAGCFVYYQLGRLGVPGFAPGAQTGRG